jgi:hypothetical protein
MGSASIAPEPCNRSESTPSSSTVVDDLLEGAILLSSGADGKAPGRKEEVRGVPMGCGARIVLTVRLVGGSLHRMMNGSATGCPDVSMKIPFASQ